MKPEITVMTQYTTFEMVYTATEKGEQKVQCFYKDVDILEPIIVKAESRRYKNAIFIIDGKYAIVRAGNWSDVA